MFLFKKVDATVLDVVTIYVCGGFLMYVVGGIAYEMGRQKGRRERKAKTMHYRDVYENQD